MMCYFRESEKQVVNSVSNYQVRQTFDWVLLKGMSPRNHSVLQICRRHLKEYVEPIH